MSASIKVGLNARQAIRNIDALIAQFPRATARALNRAGVTGRAVMAREVAKDIGLPVGKVKAEIRTEEANASKLRVRLRISGRRIPLIDFKARQTKQGVSYRLAGGRGNLPGGFISTVGSGGHRGVFKRRGRSRLPIEEKAGPSLPKVFGKHTNTGILRAGLALRKNLQSELRFALSQGAK